MPGLLALFSYGFSNYCFAIYGDGKNQSRKGANQGNLTSFHPGD
jgi:hypothetical protein